MNIDSIEPTPANGTLGQAIAATCTHGRRTVARHAAPQEWILKSLRECPVPYNTSIAIDTPESAVKYWRQHVATAEAFNHDVESMVVLFLNTRLRCKGHVLVATGLLDTLLCHPREVFRAAIVANAHSIILAHNHPSGDSSPSEADIRVTRDLRRAGELIKIDVKDHVVVGHPNASAGGRGFSSLRELGYFN